MIHRAYYLVGRGTNPYHNLALEEHLLERIPDASCVLFLWQNQRTVVVGRNQNSWKECHTAQLEADGGFLARRLSGGGAVFHDLGNLNFTFLLPSQEYNLERQLKVILLAVRQLGIQAEISGRNDITVEGRKFSGNAFYSSGGNSYHHGTLMLEVDKELVSRYLNVSANKLRSKGVDSVRSRVANLREYCPQLTVERMQQALLKAYGQVYGLSPLPYPEEWIDRKRVIQLYGKFSSWEWRMGQRLPFCWSNSRRFDWGEAELQLQADHGRVSGVQIYSDAIDTQLLEWLPDCLRGCPFSSRELAARMGGLGARESLSPEQTAMLAGLCSLVTEEAF